MITVFEPGRLLEYTWSEDALGVDLVVRFELRPERSGTAPAAQGSPDPLTAPTDVIAVGIAEVAGLSTRAYAATRMMPSAASPSPARCTQRSRSPSTTLASSTVTPGYSEASTTARPNMPILVAAT